MNTHKLLKSFKPYKDFPFLVSSFSQVTKQAINKITHNRKKCKQGNVRGKANLMGIISQRESDVEPIVGQSDGDGRDNESV